MASAGKVTSVDQIPFLELIRSNVMGSSSIVKIAGDFNGQGDLFAKVMKDGWIDYKKTRYPNLGTILAAVGVRAFHNVVSLADVSVQGVPMPTLLRQYAEHTALFQNNSAAAQPPAHRKRRGRQPAATPTTDSAPSSAAASPVRPAPVETPHRGGRRKAVVEEVPVAIKKPLRRGPVAAAKPASREATRTASELHKETQLEKEAEKVQRTSQSSEPSSSKAVRVPSRIVVPSGRLYLILFHAGTPLCDSMMSLIDSFPNTTDWRCEAVDIRDSSNLLFARTKYHVARVPTLILVDADPSSVSAGPTGHREVDPSMLPYLLR